MTYDNRHALGIPGIPYLPDNPEMMSRSMNALIVNSIPDQLREYRAWVDDLPEFEGDEGLRQGASWPEEYLQEYVRCERARRKGLRDGFAGFIAKQFAAEFVKELKRS